MIYNILQYPDPRLKRIAIPVEIDQIQDAQMQSFIDNMFETHYAQKSCAALAATQLDCDPWRITVIDYSDEKNKPLCLINPRIIDAEGEQFEEEGCMSVYPGLLREKVKRANIITVEYYDRKGTFITMKAEGFMAKCMQHEIDHLDGKLYIDRLSPLRRERLFLKRLFLKLTK